jgi:hypothetical protein
MAARAAHRDRGLGAHYHHAPLAPLGAGAGYGPPLEDPHAVRHRRSGRGGRGEMGMAAGDGGGLAGLGGAGLAGLAGLGGAGLEEGCGEGDEDPVAGAGYGGAAGYGRWSPLPGLWN